MAVKMQFDGYPSLQTSCHALANLEIHRPRLQCPSLRDMHPEFEILRLTQHGAPLPGEGAESTPRERCICPPKCSAKGRMSTRNSTASTNCLLVPRKVAFQPTKPSQLPGRPKVVMQPCLLLVSCLRLLSFFLGSHTDTARAVASGEVAGGP